MQMPSIRCSSYLDEPLAGTAPITNSWLLWEHPGSWGARIDDGYTLGQKLTEKLYSLAQQLDATVVLIRKHHKKYKDQRQYRTHHATRTVFFSSDGVLRKQELPFSCDSQFIPSIENLVSAPIIREPIFLICTNGKRDQCCALLGRELISELYNESQAAQIWECTHTGGHRFAPVLMVLSSGYTYGRLNAVVAKAIIAYARQGKVYPHNLRGRSGLTAPLQVADAYIRQLYEPLGNDAFSVISQDDDIITASISGHNYRIVLSQNMIPAHPISCGKTHEEGISLIVDNVCHIPE